MTTAALPLRIRHKNHLALRVRDLIRSRLLAAEFDGRRLPDEAQLRCEYQVGRNVVRVALARLQQEGLICRTQGAGTFPLLCKTRHTLQDARGVMRSVVSPHNRVASRVLSMDEMPAPQGLAQRLGVDVRTPCLAIDSLTTIDGDPALLLTSYIADPAATTDIAEVLRPGLWPGDWYEVLSSVGLEPRRRDVVAEAVGADDLVAPTLQIPVGAPVMRFERELRLGDRQVREYGFSHCRGDRLAFAMSDGSFAAAAVAR